MKKHIKLGQEYFDYIYNGNVNRTQREISTIYNNNKLSVDNNSLDWNEDMLDILENIQDHQDTND